MCHVAAFCAPCPQPAGLSVASREFITAENINELLTKHKVPHVFELLSVDLDFNDYWVLRSILEAGVFRPRMIVVEVNAHLGPYASVTVQCVSHADARAVGCSSCG